METIKRTRTSAKEKAIDDIVKKQANDDEAWESESEINPKLKPTSIRLSTRTIQRAKFFARVHRQRGYQSWLKGIIEERINTEYEIFKRIKKQTEHR
ncbi:MAG: hypothetical protein EHM85_19890 [Desulfobacteraceae bacterium]|nr:MAG: hypothetical protein EHM85_19890 [Desulfobacteraceae bacterium]